MDQQTVFQWQRQDDGCVVITLDVQGEKVNTLKAGFIPELQQILKQIGHCTGLVFISGKPDGFIAGADVRMIEACQTPAEAVQLSLAGQQMMSAIRALPYPVVAAIHGGCLGGGLELAMACHLRMATDHPATRFGLPEVKLGLLPGAGGTQRLPELVGLVRALPLLLQGKTLSARQALNMGLIDQLTPRKIYWQARLSWLLSHVQRRQNYPSI